MSDWPSSSVELAVPAHEEFVSAIRTLTRSTAVLADMAVDDVEELQMAIDEAAILLLPLVDPSQDQRLHTTLTVRRGALEITLRACCVAGAEVDQESLAWIMLTALDPDAAVTRHGAELSITVSRTGVGSTL